jgi:circadian clock protein KaiC
VGSAGTGKTTVASTFTESACRRGEKVLYVDLEQSAEALVGSMRSPGIDLEEARRSARLRILNLMPESAGVEQHLLRIFRGLDQFCPDHVIVDAISACRRTAADDLAFDFMLRLLTECKARGITCMFTEQANEYDQRRDQGLSSITSLVDTILALQLIQREYAMERRLLVIKSRGSRHAHEVQRFLITDHGIRLQSPPIATAPRPEEHAP